MHHMCAKETQTMPPLVCRQSIKLRFASPKSCANIIFGGLSCRPVAHAVCNLNYASSGSSRSDRLFTKSVPVMSKTSTQVTHKKVLPVSDFWANWPWGDVSLPIILRLHTSRMVYGKKLDFISSIQSHFSSKFFLFFFFVTLYFPVRES